MIRQLRTAARIVTLAGGVLAIPAVKASAQQSQPAPQAPAPAPRKHHSVAKGAVVGALGGHMTHHRHGALAGAAIGAEVQHHRNKKAMKAEKPSH
ncbi:MAG: hypothetical protein M3081_11940 [Gemmatimonadota bacterium]|nr:hypothetical protein [Gemmatimonadota bacterium]